MEEPTSRWCLCGSLVRPWRVGGEQRSALDASFAAFHHNVYHRWHCAIQGCWTALEFVRRSDLTTQEEDVDGVMAAELAALFQGTGRCELETEDRFAYRDDDSDDDDDGAMASTSGLPLFDVPHRRAGVSATTSVKHGSGSRNPMASLLEQEDTAEVCLACRSFV
jgi:hypothetical protein